jgi:hypothetical protein
LSERLITIAYGPEKYIRMARALALSYRRHNQRRPFAIVTDDRNTKDLENYFDLVIPLNPTYGVGVVQKLNLDRYSPFDETLFADSDCIFYKSPERIWRLYASKDFTVRGWRYLTGRTEYGRKSPYEFVRNTPDFLRQNNIRRLPHFNSGPSDFLYECLNVCGKEALSGRESIYLNGSILGMSRAEIRAKFDEIVAFAEIEKFLDTPVKRYSSGMYVRLAFAVAAHLEPEILIVDEVLAVGDTEFQKKCLGKMKDVGKCGRTVLFVSHNMKAVLHLCSKGLLLRSGQAAHELEDVAYTMRRYT